MLVSCGGRLTTASQEAGDTVVFKYATQLSIVRHKDYTEVVVKNPWKEGKILHSYLLVPDSIDPQDISPSSFLDIHHRPHPVAPLRDVHHRPLCHAHVVWL